MRPVSLGCVRCGCLLACVWILWVAGVFSQSLYRSEEMTYMQIVISREAAYETIRPSGA